MAKQVRYALYGEEAIAKDAEWRRNFICGVDKEYSILRKRNNSHRHEIWMDIIVADDTAILFKFRYPKNIIFIQDYVKPN